MITVHLCIVQSLSVGQKAAKSRTGAAQNAREKTQVSIPWDSCVKNHGNQAYTPEAWAAEASASHSAPGHEELQPTPAKPVIAVLAPGKHVGSDIQCRNCFIILRTCQELVDQGSDDYWQRECARAQRWTRAPSTKNWRCPPCSSPLVQEADPHEECIGRHGKHGDHPALPRTRLASSPSPSS